MKPKDINFKLLLNTMAPSRVIYFHYAKEWSLYEQDIQNCFVSRELLLKF